jgi:hypothetical protein
MRNALLVRLLSPVQYKNVITISIDGGREINYGSAWWRKQYAGAPTTTK